MNCTGKLKSTDFLVGNRKSYRPKANGIVEITDKEDHPIWGIRYRVKYHDEWFEANCFDWVKDN